jgi:hypothetical protein
MQRVRRTIRMIRTRRTIRTIRTDLAGCLLHACCHGEILENRWSRERLEGSNPSASAVVLLARRIS